MLYIFTGEDFESRKKSYEKIYTTLQKKRPDAHLVKIEHDNPELLQELEQYVHSQGLFDEKSIISIRGMCENTTYKKYLIDQASTLAESANAFILNENNLSEAEIKKIESKGAHIYSFQDKQNKTNLFYLGDLLLQKNKSKLWVSIQEELARGISIEEIMGILMYQTRVLHLSLTNKTQPQSIKPFVYKKCTNSQWKVDQVVKLHLNLITQYHESRRGGMNLEKKLEYLILKI